MARHQGIVVRALTWNLFHGRDWPPDESLQQLRSRITRRPERNDTYIQVNRPLLAEFTATLAQQPWDVALLQEAPPRWLGPLSRGTGAHAVVALTSRNTGAAVRAWVARRNPDVIGANEGGSNQLLVRPPWRVEEVRRLSVAFKVERRRLLWAKLRGPEGRVLCVGNIHGSCERERSSLELVAAAGHSHTWAAGAPLIFGGDLNARPALNPAAFEAVASRYGLTAPTAPYAIDHLLASGLSTLEPAHALPAAVRELPGPENRLIRLSDHEIVTAEWRMD